MIDDDYDPGVGLWPLDDPFEFPSDKSLGELGFEEQIQQLVEWFLWNFEDPAHETPRDSGEFVYIWGGPYDAADQIGDRFGGIVSDESIDAAVQEVEGHCIDWAPNGRRVAPLETGPPEEAGAEALEEFIEQANRRLEALEAAMGEVPFPSSMLGHNNPPEALDDFPYSQKDEQDLKELIHGLRDDLSKTPVNAAPIDTKTEQLKFIGEKISGWLKDKGNAAVDSAVKSFGTALGVAGAAALVKGLNYLNEKIDLAVAALKAVIAMLL